jgi:DNA-binding response OmpR family regulator
MTARAARLVLVDDDELLREVLAGNLTQAGFSVTLFADPMAALAAALPIC